MSNHSTADKGMRRTGFNRLLCVALCTPRLLIFFKVKKKNLVLLFDFLPVAFLISNRFQCVISQIKGNKFLIKFLIYYFWVGVMPFELWSNEFTVKLLFLHTVQLYLRIHLYPWCSSPYIKCLHLSQYCNDEKVNSFSSWSASV